MSNPFQFSITGTPITTDTDPNSSAPAAGRRWTIPAPHENADEGAALAFALDDGTSVVVQLWEFVHGTAWSALGSAFTVAADVRSAPIGVTRGGTYFAQITTATGAPTILSAEITVPIATATVAISGTVAVSAASLPLPALAATSTKQSDGTQKTQVVDGSGNVAPSGDTVGRAGFTKVTDGTDTADVTAASTAAVAAAPALVVALSPNNAPVPYKTTSTDAGQDLALADASAHAFASAAGTGLGVMVSAPLANPQPAYVALGSGVTTSTGIELQPGDRVWFPGVDNANKIYAIVASGSNHLHAVAF